MKRRTVGLAAAGAVLAVGLTGTYAAIGMHYREHFFEHTVINGIDVSGMTAAEAEALIAEQAEDYRVTVTTKDGTQEIIEGAEIGYRFVSGGEVQGFLDGQDFLAWLPECFGEGNEYTMEASVAYDEELLVQAVDELNCMQEEQITEPEDAYIEQQEDGTYVIIPETEGNAPDRGKVQQLLKDTVDAGAVSADLELADCYLKPSVYAEDEDLKSEAAIRNQYSSITVTYQMGGGVTEILDSTVTAEWFSLDENREPVFDRDAVAAWVNQLADTYDTIGTYPAFTTSNGETVYVEARTYGWQMDRETETEELYNLLLAGESAERTPVWYETAQTRGTNDIGNTYVEIDYTNQRMWYYKDGVLLVETPVVTGNVSADMASPEGIFCIVGKQENATLIGDDYETPVDYWMPFYGGVGIHDADSWRTAYGGDIYLWSGSHGCINTPTAQAAVIFENIEVGTPVICYSSATNYGYSQVGSSGGTAGSGSGDIVIVDSGATDTWTDDVVIDDAGDGATWDYGADNITAGDVGAGDNAAGDTGVGDIADENGGIGDAVSGDAETGSTWAGDAGVSDITAGITGTGDAAAGDSGTDETMIGDEITIY